jgi:hypothetical protein
MGKEIDRGLLLLVLALVGVYAYPKSPGRSETPTPTESKAVAAAVTQHDEATAAATDGSLRLLRNLTTLLVDIDPTAAAPKSNDRAAADERAAHEPAATPGSPKPNWNAAALAAKIRATRDLDVLVAAVPDPRQSHMALFFDQALVALRKGLVRAGFQQDRFYLPWNSHGDKKSDASDEHADNEGTSLDPGIILFRNTQPLRRQEPAPPRSSASGPSSNTANEVPACTTVDSRPSLLVVFLVAESPVTGISARQAQSALSVARELSGDCACNCDCSDVDPCFRECDCSPHPLQVLGPVFSGGMASWREALNRVVEPTDPKARLVSGTATAPLANFEPRSADRFSFERTATDDADLKAALFCEICAADPKARIASVSEMGSVYGSSSEPQLRKQRPVAAELARLNKTCPVLYGDVVAGSLEPPDSCKIVDELSFPLHISEVRAEHELDTTSDASATPRRILGLKLDPREEAEPDTPHSFSSLTTYDEELSLGQELTRLCRDRVKYLQIVATDPIDVVFLAQEARKFCPDLTLSTLGWDALYMHPDLSPPLSGMLVATPYPPLFPFRDMTSDDEPMPSASSAAAGYENAISCLLPDVKRSSSTDSHCSSPNLWVTQVRAGTLWPLASTAVPPPAAPPRPNAFGRIVAWLLLVLALAHTFFRARALAAHCRRGVVSSRTFFARVFTIPPRGYRAGQACAQSAADLSLALLISSLIPVASVYLSSRDTTWLPFQWTFVLLGAGSAVLLAVFGLVALVVSLHEFSRGGVCAGSRGMLTIPLSLLAVGGYELYWLRAVFSDGVGERAYFLLRTTASFALSPLVPIALCLVCVYLWALLSLKRANLLARFTTLAPVTQAAPEVLAAFREASDELHGLPHRSDSDREGAAALLGSAPERPPGLNWRSLVLHPANAGALAALSFTAVFAYLHLRPTFEQPAFQDLFLVAFLTPLGIVVFGLARFVLVSRSLFWLLRSLSAEPMVDAYTRIASKVSGSFGLQLNARVAPVIEYQIAVSACTSLCQLAVDMSALTDGTGPTTRVEATIAQSADSLRHHCGTLAKEFHAAALDRTASIDLEARTHGALAATSECLHAVLVNVWAERSCQLSPAKILAAVPAEALNHGGAREKDITAAVLPLGLASAAFLWQRLAEDFVAMRITAHVYMTLHSLRNMLAYLISATFLLVLALHAYPFQPARMLSVFGWVLVVTVAMVGLFRLLRLERNEVLSRLAGKEPEKVTFDFDFVSRLVLYVVVPLGFALAGLFPEVSDAIARVLTPLKTIVPP